MARKKRKPAKIRARMRAASVSLLPGYVDDIEWRSLLDELGPGDVREPQWRIHDQTHLELAIDHPLNSGKHRTEWECYYFFPRSFRIDKEAYPRARFYGDQQTYVRFALQQKTFQELTEKDLPELERVLKSANTEKKLAELKLFASTLRTSLFVARRTLQEMLEAELDQSPDASETADIEAASLALASGCKVFLAEFRTLLSAQEFDEGMQIAARLTDEAISRNVETVFATLSLSLRQYGEESLAAQVAKVAVDEARYRRAESLDEVGSATAERREIEHLEFRRGVLKKFTESQLWLRAKPMEAGKLTLQVLYALAASVAMSFAVVMAAYHGPQDRNAFGDLWTWAAIVILAYAGKDRIKSTLQQVFSRWVAKRYPQRKFKLQPREHQDKKAPIVGYVDENTHYPSTHKLPKDVLEVRNSSRSHEVEQRARPEQVLFHHRIATLDGEAARAIDNRFVALTEIVRLDFSNILAHTDDPKRRIVFADPDDAHIYSAMAPRVYNVSIVYRCKRGDETSPWKRIRVVVSRKGIKRIEPVV